MPRRARLALPGVPLHVIQRGNNRQPCFFAADDHRRYLGWLAEQAGRHAVAVHAYCLMTNHVHLLLTPATADGAARLMKSLGQRHAQHVNRAHGRSGTLWQGRFRSCPVEDERWLIACYRYIELNPVRAAMVAAPGDYPWSSYGANALGRPDPAVVPHERYLALDARSPARRRAAYRALLAAALEPDRLAAIRRATNGNFALGDPAFQARVAAALGRRATPGRPGRPPRAAQPAGE